MLIPEKPQQKSRLLFNSSKKNLGKVHKGKNKKKKKTEPNKKNPNKNHWSSGAKRTKKHFIETKGKKHTQRRVWASWWVRDTLQVFFFWSSFYLIFSPLNGRGSFWLWVEYSLRGGLRCGLDCTRLHQLLVLRICLLKPSYMNSKSCFPLNCPLLAKYHTWKFVQGHKQLVHLYCACSRVFMVRVSCSESTNFLF